MESYELDADKVIEWGVNHADFDELERVSKALYAVYVQRRKQEFPDKHKENRRHRRRITKTGEFREKKPKKDKDWSQAVASAKRQLAHSNRTLL